MRIYVAGPYTKGDVILNIRAAVEAGSKLAKMGHAPFIPHLTAFWHIIDPHEYQFWLDQDNEWVKVCEGLLRLPGVSSGADKEVALAESIGIPVWLSIDEVPEA